MNVYSRDNIQVFERDPLGQPEFDVVTFGAHLHTKQLAGKHFDHSGYR
jgi:hypothetical protein